MCVRFPISFTVFLAVMILCVWTDNVQCAGSFQETHAEFVNDAIKCCDSNVLSKIDILLMHDRALAYIAFLESISTSTVFEEIFEIFKNKSVDLRFGVATFSNTPETCYKKITPFTSDPEEIKQGYKLVSQDTERRDIRKETTSLLSAGAAANDMTLGWLQLLNNNIQNEKRMRLIFLYTNSPTLQKGLVSNAVSKDGMSWEVCQNPSASLSTVFDIFIKNNVKLTVFLGESDSSNKHSVLADEWNGYRRSIPNAFDLGYSTPDGSVRLILSVFQIFRDRICACSTTKPTVEPEQPTTMHTTSIHTTMPPKPTLLPTVTPPLVRTVKIPDDATTVTSVQPRLPRTNVDNSRTTIKYTFATSLMMSRKSSLHPAISYALGLSGLFALFTAVTCACAHCYAVGGGNSLLENHVVNTSVQHNIFDTNLTDTDGSVINSLRHPSFLSASDV